MRTPQSEATLAAVDAEFDTLQRDGIASLDDVHLRLRFLQLVALKQLRPGDWESVRMEAVQG